MKAIVLKVRNLPNSVDTDLFVYCLQQDVAVSYPRGKVELVSEIVRCKDCRYYHGINEECGARKFYPPSGDRFCADGERRNDDA